MKKLYVFLLLTAFVFSNSLAQDVEFSNKIIQQFKTAKLKASRKSANSHDYLWYSPLALKAFNNWSLLTDEAKNLFPKTNTRPVFTGTEQILTSGNFALHYTTDGPTGEKISAADLDQNQIPDYAETMLATFIKVSQLYHTTSSLTSPPNDNAQTNNAYYDIYVSGTEAGDWTYGYVMPETELGNNPNSPNLTEEYSYTSYMVMRNNYEGFGDEKVAMEVTAAHEYMHAVQMGYDGYMDSWFMEAAATWSEDFVFPGHDDNFQYLGNIFSTPDVALDLANDEANGDFDDHWYGSWIFVRYLTEHTNNSIMKAIYERSINEYSIYAIEDELAANWNNDFYSLFTQFVISNSLMTNYDEVFTPYTYSRATDYDLYINEELNGLKYENSASSFNFTGESIAWNSLTNGNNRLMRLSADYFKLSSNQNFKLNFTTTNQSAEYDLVLLKVKNVTNPLSDSDIEIVLADANGNITVNDYSNWTKFIPIVIRYNAFTDNTLALTYNLNITSNTTSIESENKENLSIYPNPASEYLHIKYSNDVYLRAKITDLSGKVILDEQVNDAKIDVRTLNNGIYFISLQNDEKIITTQKIIINN